MWLLIINRPNSFESFNGIIPFFGSRPADRILITKESGATGGFPEKVAAARDCGMTVAVLARPQDFPGLTCEAWLQRIKEGNL